TRPNRTHHAEPDDPNDRAPRDQDDDHDDRQEHYDVADTSERVLDMGHVWPQSVTDRVADPDSVGHEEHRPEQVPAQERAKGKADGTTNGPRKKANPADESRDADSQRTISADERLCHNQTSWLQQPTGVTVDRCPSIVAPEPITKVVAGDSADEG